MEQTFSSPSSPAPRPLTLYKASAGSGKTFKIAVEYIALLAEDPSAYRHTLAVTFTNAATAEMKGRVVTALQGIAQGEESAADYAAEVLRVVNRTSSESRTACGFCRVVSEEGDANRTSGERMDGETLRRRAAEALSMIIHDWSRFRIVTIDSFFQSIVRDLAAEMDVPVNARPSVDEDEVLGEAVENLLRSLPEGSALYRAVTAHMDERMREGGSWEIAESLKTFGKNIFSEKFLAHGAETRDRVCDIEAVSRYRAMAEAEAERWRKTAMEMAKRMLNTWSEGMDERVRAKNIGNFLEKVAEWNVRDKTFSPSVAAHMDDVDKWFLANKKRGEMEALVRGTLMPELRRLWATSEECEKRQNTWRVIGKHALSLTLLGSIGAEVARMNAEAGRYQIGETAAMLRDVISDDNIPFIYEKTGTTYRNIMIDEFQDTSSLQWKNFKPLILNGLASGGRTLIVGDVKQSIYRFRNSDWHILNDIGGDADLSGMAEMVVADRNYRSAGRVVAFNNEFFAKTIEVLRGVCPDLETAYGGLEQKAKDPSAGFVRVDDISAATRQEHSGGIGNGEGNGDTTVPTLEERMIEEVGASIRRLMERGVKPQDITILVRANKDAHKICEHFSAHPEEIGGAPIVSSEAFRLDASPVVNLIVDALRALDTDDNLSALATLAFRYQVDVAGGADTAHKALLCGTAKELDRFLPEDFNTERRETLRFLPLGELAESVWRIFGLGRIEGQNQYIFSFKDLVANFREDHTDSIGTFLRAWDEKLRKKPIAGCDIDGIRISTIHKSKGLEYHSVIVPFCTWRLTPKPTDLIWCEPDVAPYDTMPIVPASMTKATANSLFRKDYEREMLNTLVDNINALYVAFTRAKHNLIVLTGRDDRTDGKDGNTANGGIQTVRDLLAAASPLFGSEWGTPTPSPQPDGPAHALGDFRPPSLMGQPTRWATSAVLAGWAYRPARGLVAFVSDELPVSFRQSHASELFLSSLPGSPTTHNHAERVRLISVGNLYHAIFQLIKTPNDIDRAVAVMQAKGCFGTLLDANQARRQVTRLVAEVSESHPEWFSPEWTPLNERAILFGKDGEAETLRPDRIVVKGHRAIIIDYKTATGTTTPPADNVRQLTRYKQLLNECGFTDTQAFLWFILDEKIIEV